MPESRRFGWGELPGVWEQQRHMKRKIQLGEDEAEEAAEGPL